MSRRSLLAFASILFALTYVPNAIAAQNMGSNWLSRSCGCSIADKYYVKIEHDNDSGCVPDGSAANACTGVCSFTKHPAGPVGGTIMQPKSSTPGGGVFFNNDDPWPASGLGRQLSSDYHANTFGKCLNIGERQ